MIIKDIIVTRTNSGFGLAKLRNEGWTHLRYGDMSAFYDKNREVLLIEYAGIDSLADFKSLIDALYEEHNPIPKKKKKGKKK